MSRRTRSPRLEESGAESSVGRSSPARPNVARARRIVVKLGTRVLVDDCGRPAEARIASLIETTAGLRLAGREVIVVSSGAVSLGAHALGLARGAARGVALGPDKLPTSSGKLQASAAVGQARLTTIYQQLFSRFGVACGQLLISQRDFDDRERSVELRRTLETLLRHDAVPLLNENDALRRRGEVPSVNGPYSVFEDNDRLAALVAGTLTADLLVLLTDVRGIFDRDPRRYPDARLLPTLADLDTDAANDTRRGQLPWLDAGSTPGPGRGGMKSKVEAALIASRGGCSTVIADGREPGVFSRVVAGEEVGTWIPARSQRLAVRHHWIAFASAPRGTLHLDAGAVDALVLRSGSLLAAGVHRIEGRFRPGDVVELRRPDGSLLGHGRSRLGDTETKSLAARSGFDRTPPLIRRDDIVFHTTSDSAVAAVSGDSEHE